MWHLEKINIMNNDEEILEKLSESKLVIKRLEKKIVDLQEKIKEIERKKSGDD